jgi:hypothetical protein
MSTPLSLPLPQVYTSTAKVRDVVLKRRLAQERNGLSKRNRKMEHFVLLDRDRMKPLLKTHCSHDAIFYSSDRDSSGGLDEKEFLELLRKFSNVCGNLGYRMSPEEAEIAVRLLGKAGTSKKGALELSFNDFRSWWTQDDRFKALQWTEEEFKQLKKMRDEFVKFDADGNGVISPDEFALLHPSLLRLGFGLPASADTCWKAMDSDGNGVISFNEFVSYLRQINAFPASPGLEGCNTKDPEKVEMTEQVTLAAWLDAMNDQEASAMFKVQKVCQGFQSR